jgi:putative addiction module component (TIGR02574 family)
MTPSGQKVLEAAIALPDDERAELISALLETLPDDAAHDLDPEWEAEIAQRVADFDSGKDKGVAWEDVRERLTAVRQNDRTKN